VAVILIALQRLGVLALADAFDLGLLEGIELDPRWAALWSGLARERACSNASLSGWPSLAADLADETAGTAIGAIAGDRA
jgi:hypothetical protein